MAPKAKQRHVSLAIWAGLLTFLLDQLSKHAVVVWMDLRRLGRVEIMPPYLEFHMAWNEGVNFGLFSRFDMRWVLIAVAFAICALVVWWLRREGGSKWVYISAGLLIGGALGNVIDRIRWGAVADFLNMSCCGYNNPYAFNVADVAIFAGGLGLALFSSSGSTKKPKKNKTT